MSSDSLQSPLLRPLLELAVACNQAVGEICAGNTVEDRVVIAASWLSAWLEANSSKGHLIKSETVIPYGVAKRILSELHGSIARTWLVERDGVYVAHEIERLEKAMSGLLVSFTAGTSINQDDAQAIHAAARSLRLAYWGEAVANSDNASPRLQIDLPRMTVTLNEEEYPVRSKQALRWLTVLINHPEEWMPAKDLSKYDSELDGARTDQLRRYLPHEVAALIQSETGKGSRINL